MQDQLFAPIPMRQHRIIDSDKNRYRVFRSNGEFITIEARSAYEAFKSSGFAEARRIVRLTRYVSPYLDRSELTEVSQAASAVANQGKKSEQHVAAPAPQGAPLISVPVEQVQTMALGAMQPKEISEDDGIEEVVPAATPVQFKAPKRSLASEAPGAADTTRKPERTMLTVQDIDKLLGK